MKRKIICLIITLAAIAVIVTVIAVNANSKPDDLQVSTAEPTVEVSAEQNEATEAQAASNTVAEISVSPEYLTSAVTKELVLARVDSLIEEIDMRVIQTEYSDLSRKAKRERTKLYEDFLEEVYDFYDSVERDEITPEKAERMYYATYSLRFTGIQSKANRIK